MVTVYAPLWRCVTYYISDGFDGAGLWWVPVEHEGNENWSSEEIEVVELLVGCLTNAARWIDHAQEAKPLTGADILVVALVASPRLLEPECRTSRQMQLANALCRFRELANELRLE